MSKGDDTQYKRKAKPAFNGIVKLASLLQKALDTGRSNHVEMSEISRYISHYVKAQIDDSTVNMDYILNNYADRADGFKRVRDDLVVLFDGLGETKCSGYEKLLTPNGGVNKDMLEELIEIDTEITNTMNQIKSALMTIKNSGEVTEDEVKEINILAKELRVSVDERIGIVM